MPQIDADRQKNWFLRLLPMFKGFHLLTVAVFIFSIAAIFFQVVIPALVGNSIDALSQSANQQDIDNFEWALMILIAAGIARSSMNFTVRYLLFKLTYGVETALRKAFYSKLNYLPLAYFSKMKSGDLVSRSNSDMRAIQTFILFAPYNVIVFMTFVLSIFYMLSISVKLALICLLSLPLTFVLSLRLRKVVYPLSWLVQTRMAEVTTVIDENIKGHAIVTAFAKEKQQIGLFKKVAEKLRWVTQLQLNKKARYSPWIEHLAVLSQICVLLYGGWLVIEGQMLLGDLVAFNMYVLMMMIPFKTLGDVLVMGRNARAAAGRIFEVLDQPDDQIYQYKTQTMPVDAKQIRFVDTSFSYHATTQGGENCAGVLNQFNGRFNQGEITAVVGKTGCGKSTLAQLLMMFYRPDSGSIDIDGINIDQLSIQSVRTSIAMVHQEGFLFAETIKKNIAFGRPEASMAEILAAAKIAQVNLFVDELALGYDTQVGEHGSTLSGGQRQRLNIAQAILTQPSVLILDDATSSLDLSTESALLQQLKKAFSKTIIIFISHRRSVVEQSDKVIFIEDGQQKLVDSEQNKHDHLLRLYPWYGAFFNDDDVNSTVGNA